MDQGTKSLYDNESSIKNEGQNALFRLELEPPLKDDENECIHGEEEKESSEEGQSGAGSGSVPLAVPMMAHSVHSSVTRNDAKVITETRLKRLRVLSQRSDSALSKGQKDEKKRIIRLEKNRRAAAMSRRKKKIYVRNLEDNSKLMARHIAILEMENAHLRAFMTASQHTQGQPMRAGLPPMHPMYQMPHFSGSNMPQFNMGSTSSANGCHAAPSSVHTTPSTNSVEPPTKRRKINDTSTSSVSDQFSEMDPLTEDNEMEPVPMEPLPLPIPVNAPPSIPRMMAMIPPHLMASNMGGIHPSQMMPYPMHHSMAPLRPNVAYSASAPAAVPSQALLPEIGKLEGIVTDKDNEISDSNKHSNHSMEEYERKSVEMDEHYSGYLDDMPLVPDTDLCHLSILDDPQHIAVIHETVDEEGSVIECQPDLKATDMNMAYL